MYDTDDLVSPAELLRPFDPAGPMHGLGHWSPLTAAQRAREEGIGELSEAHWHVIYTLRDRYRENGPAASARELTRALEKEFAAQGGRRYLYELFPKGPVTQGCRLAGVPPPPFASDPSFGWSA